MSNTFDADVRYGSSFLSVSNKDKAVQGEILSDKLTGEIYIKRTDGKVISFRQRAHTVYEAIQEFNMQFQSSIGFIYPSDPGAYLLGTKLIVDEFKPNETKTDILLENHTFSEIYGDEKDFRFPVSVKTNGFYIKPITRLGDRNVCGFLSGQFSEHEHVNFDTTVRSFTDWLDLSTLYTNPYLYTTWKSMEKWISANAMVDCTITTIGSTSEHKVIENVKQLSIPIMLNEYSFVKFPDDYDEEMKTIHSVDVVINKIYVPKLQYERYLATNNNTTSGIDAVVERMMDMDNKVVLQSVDVFYFITGAIQLPTNSNTIIDHCIDVEFLDQAIVDISTSSGARSIQSQVEEPSAWSVDAMWAEELRHINGTSATETNSINKFKDLERSLYNDSDDTITFTNQIANAENLLIVSTEYDIK